MVAELWTGEGGVEVSGGRSGGGACRTAAVRVASEGTEWREEGHGEGASERGRKNAPRKELERRSIEEPRRNGKKIDTVPLIEGEATEREIAER